MLGISWSLECKVKIKVIIILRFIFYGVSGKIVCKYDDLRCWCFFDLFKFCI